MSAHPIRIDFVRRGPAPAVWRWAALGLGAAALLLALLNFIDVQSTWKMAHQSWQLAQGNQARNRPAPPDPHLAALQAERAKAVNPYIQQLNLGWGPLFKALAAPERLPVRLLGIDTGAAAGKLRIAAEADSVGAMADYVTLLAGRSGLRDVYLVRHEMQPAERVRFEVEAVWTTEP